jgi:two-component system sensor histidine kinase RstB
MIRLFVKFLVLLSVIFLSGRWTFYRLLQGQVYDDRQRLVSGLTEIHIGGLRFIASELATADEPTRELRWTALQAELESPLEVRPMSELSAGDRSRLRQPEGFVYVYRNEIIDYLGVRYDEEHYLRLGPLAYKTIKVIEGDVAEWLRVLARRLNRVDDIDAYLAKVTAESRVRAELTTTDSVPAEARQRLVAGEEVAFFGIENDYFVAMPFRNPSEVLVLGPLPKVRALAEQLLIKAMAIWYAIVIASAGWLVYNVAGKFQRIELAATKIAKGDFGARVNESGAGESKVLANAFNRMAAKTESSIRSKDELLQVVSHELRTPLARLRFAVELLDSSPDQELKRSRMLVVQQSIDNLDAIVNEVLDYVRNEDDAMAKSREWIEIRPALMPMIQVFEIENPKLKFEWAVASDTPCTDVYAERIALCRSIGNLVSNAVRYAKSKVLIRIYYCVDVASDEAADGSTGESVCIEVEDDGPGIPDAMRAEVMAPFVRIAADGQGRQGLQSPLRYRTDDATQVDFDAASESSHSYAGLGLGLTIVERTLRQHGGRVSIHRGELGGCLVRTRWPIPRLAP